MIMREGHPVIFTRHAKRRVRERLQITTLEALSLFIRSRKKCFTATAHIFDYGNIRFITKFDIETYIVITVIKRKKHED